MTDSPAGDAASLAHVLPQAIAQAFASVLQQVPVQAVTQQHLCAQCVLARMAWGTANQGEVNAAIARAAQAHGISEEAARAAQVDPAPFLPERVRQSMPPLQPAVTTVQGTEVCASHIPGRPGGQQLLIASGRLSQSMIAGIG